MSLMSINTVLTFCNIPATNAHISFRVHIFLINQDYNLNILNNWRYMFLVGAKL